jgi:hypothetical protein
MNICFIANYTKTFFFDAIAEKLKDENCNICWIAVNKSNYDFLIGKYPSSSILYLPKDKVLNQKNAIIDDFKLNELVYGDRALKYDFEVGFRFLSNIQSLIYDFLKSNQVKFIFGESTWAHEVLISRIAKYRSELNCMYLDMHTVRIPNDRFSFFTNEFHENFLITESNYANLVPPHDAFELKKPYYLAINDKIVKDSISIKGRIKRLKSYITGENLDVNDITLLTKGNKQRTLLPIQNELNKESYKKVKTVGYDFLKNKNFILATLHKQPEASIDVAGRYVEDQKNNLINLWRILPEDWILLVKEHSNAIGDRPYSWFKSLANYRNIVFAHEKLDSHILIDMCKAVYTIAGTVAYEAALKHKPALVSIDLFFNFPYLKKIDTELLRNCKNMEDIIQQIPDKSIDEEQLKRKIYFNSYPGIIGDPLNVPTCMADENIRNVSNAILKLKNFI